jgi:hypothetical protein
MLDQIEKNDILLDEFNYFVLENVTLLVPYSSNYGSQIQDSSVGARKTILSQVMRKKRKESRMMKSKITFGALALSLFFAAGALAGPGNKGSLKLSDSVTVGGKQLAPGEYELAWTGTGSNVELSISSGKETIAKVPAQLITLNKTEPASGYSTNTNADGSKTLTGISFGGKKYELSLGDASGKGEASN